MKKSSAILGLALLSGCGYNAVPKIKLVQEGCTVNVEVSNLNPFNENEVKIYHDSVIIPSGKGFFGGYTNFPYWDRKFEFIGDSFLEVSVFTYSRINEEFLKLSKKELMVYCKRP